MAQSNPIIPLRDKQSDTWAATDGLGRALPDNRRCGPPRPGKTVGVFYFLWLGYHDLDVYDITQLLKENPDSPQYGPPRMFHWWGEPHLGYYQSGDPFVIQTHAQMLTDAGVDMIILDVTNNVTYDQTLLTLCRVYEQMRGQGQATPQIAFLLNSGSARVAQYLYDNFYAKNLHRALWFEWQGKPLILASQEGVDSPQVRDFFTWRHSWAWTEPNSWFGDGRDKWPWLDHYPQKPGWHADPHSPEQVSVNVAQHPISNIGRSFHAGAQPLPGETNTDAGLCFAEQWGRALELDPEFVLVTGWNEWVAQRFLKQDNDDPPQEMLGRTLAVGDSYFVDQYNKEYSRDIEPMKGGYGDAYYYQLVEYIRRFKGARPVPKSGPPTTIDMDAGFAQWSAVTPSYFGNAALPAARDFPGWGGLHFAGNTSRNAFDELKVAHDSEFLYFYACTHAPITPPEGEAWMTLLLRIHPDAKAQWEGFDFVVNRTRRGEDTCLLERREVGGTWQPVADVKYAARGQEMHLAVPRAALNLPPGPLRIEFKWMDNIPIPCDPLDWIDKGNCAPTGRFRYCYEE